VRYVMRLLRAQSSRNMPCSQSLFVSPSMLWSLPAPSRAFPRHAHARPVGPPRELQCGVGARGVGWRKAGGKVRPYGGLNEIMGWHVPWRPPRLRCEEWSGKAAGAPAAPLFATPAHAGECA